MKLVRFGDTGTEKPGILDPDSLIRDLSNVVSDINGVTLSLEEISHLQRLDPANLPRAPEGVRLKPCVAGTGKFICIGLNYADHAAESGMEIPSESVLFLKATSAICGPGDPIVIPRGGTKTDWEAELAVLIRDFVKYVSEEDAMDHVGGYAATNDVSEREYQLERAGQWIKGKSCDNFGQLGPWLVTKEEIRDPQNLAMWLTVNGETMQNGSTKTMVYGVAHLVSHLSQFMTLHHGDVISTSTPPGVGLGMDPSTCLKDGDVVELGIDGLGRQHQNLISN